jgi:hypothetical protein
LDSYFVITVIRLFARTCGHIPRDHKTSSRRILMDTLILALGPAFAVGFALQRLLEIVGAGLDAAPFVDQTQWAKWKPVSLGILAFGAGLVTSWSLGLQVLAPLGLANRSEPIEVLVTALVISAGTEGLNSILKFLGYAKESQKATAITALESAATKVGSPADAVNLDARKEALVGSSANQPQPLQQNPVPAS